MWANRDAGQEEMSAYLPYNPGALPSSPSPVAGEGVSLIVEGLPPYKDVNSSIRNPKHKYHSRFTILRQAAIDQMGGRAPYRGAVRIDFAMHAPQLEKNRYLVDYQGGIADTLDGSRWRYVYLPANRL